MFIYSFMLYYVETGLTNYVLSKSTARDRPCKAHAKSNGKMTAFKLKDFIPAFFFFGVGCCISLLLFLLELIIAVVFSKRKIHNSTPTVLE